MQAGPRVNQGGSGEPVLLLLHGLGATGDVWQGWRPLLARRWLAPDLPGHGGSPPLSSYTFESLAAAVADTVGTDAHTVVLEHSLGGWPSWPWPAAGSTCRCGRSSAWGSRSPGAKTSWTVREP